MNLETEELLEVNEERLELLCRRVLGAGEEHATVVRLMVKKFDQVSIAEPILQHYRALEIREDDTADPVDW